MVAHAAATAAAGCAADDGGEVAESAAPSSFSNGHQKPTGVVVMVCSDLRLVHWATRIDVIYPPPSALAQL